MKDEREQIVSGLRQLADFLESNPDVPLPLCPSLGAYLEPEAFRAAVRTIGSCDKEPTDTMFGVEKHFGGVTYRLITRREGICERVVIGTKTVEAIPAHEEEIAEWRCGEVLR